MFGRNDQTAVDRLDATAELALVEAEHLGEIGAVTLHPTARRAVAPVARAEIERSLSRGRVRTESAEEPWSYTTASSRAQGAIGRKVRAAVSDWQPSHP